MLYDPLGRCVKITEATAGSVTSTKQFVWCGNERCEERDGSGSLSNGKQFYGLGQVNYASGTPTSYFYNLDHLGSVREMTKTVSGTTTIEAQYAYGAWGEVTKLAGSADSDFQYAGYYKHARSGLDLTLYRAYSAGLGRWISRDPLGESAGVNLYGYVGGNPIGFVDPLGLIEVPTLQEIFGPGIQNLADPAFDLAIVNVSLELGTMGLWGVVPATGTALGFANMFPRTNTPIRSQRGAMGGGGGGGGGGARCPKIDTPTKEDLEGMTVPEMIKYLTDLGFKATEATDGWGIKFTNPTRKGDHVRIMLGTNSSDPYHQGPRVNIARSGVKDVIYLPGNIGY